MNGPMIVAEAGSTWVKKEYAREFMKRSKDAGAGAVKFQLFENKPEYTDCGNIYLPLDLFQEFYSMGKEIGIKVTASVFYEKALETLFQLDVPFIKFSHSQRFQVEWMKAALKIGKQVVVSTSVMDMHVVPKDCIKLFCQPVYPTMWHTNFEGLFPDRFQGLSDHSLGIEESIRAIKSGAWWLERHVSLEYTECRATPDGKVSLSFEELTQLCKEIKP